MVKDGRKDGNMAGGSSGGIPDTLPLFLVGDGDYCIFPFREATTISIKVMDNPRANAFVQALKESGYIICVPFLQSTDMPEVGVVGSARDFEFFGKESGRTLSFKFRGFYRVFFQINEKKSANGIFMLNWRKMTDVPIFSYESDSEEFAEELERFKALYREFSFSKLFNDGIRTVEGLERLSIVEELVEEADAGSLAQAIDAVLTVINDFRGFFGDFGLVSYYTLLRETRVSARLKSINKLLFFLTQAALLSSLEEKEEKEEKEVIEGDDLETLDGEWEDEDGVLTPKSSVALEPVNKKRSDEETIKEKFFLPADSSYRPEPVRTDVPDGEWIELDTSRRPALFESGMEFFRQRLVSQTPAVEQIMKTLVAIQAGFSDPRRPTVIGVFLGPTGVGKTESVRTLAEFLFGDPEGYVHIEGNSLLMDHSISRIIGADPNYVGYGTGIKQWDVDRAHVFRLLREKYKSNPDALKKILEQMTKLEAMMKTAENTRASAASEKTKETLVQVAGWRPGRHLGLILLDEMEKVHLNIQRFLLRVLDDGIISRADGERVSVKNAIFVFTGNIYGREIAGKISGRGRIGIHPTTEETVEGYRNLTDEIYRETLSAAEKILLPELLGRIGKEKIRVFHPFGLDDVGELIKRIRLPALAEFLKERGIELYVSEAVLSFLQKEVFDPANRSLGARSVESVIRRRIIEEIANLCGLGDHGIKSGDTILVDVKDKEDETGKKIIIKKLLKRNS